MATALAARPRRQCRRSSDTQAFAAFPLAALDREGLSALLFDEARDSARDSLASEGDCVDRSMLILDGCAARSKLTAEGERQIVSLHVAGDLIDLHSALMEVADHDIVAIGPLRVARVAHDAVRGAANGYPASAKAL